MRNQNFMDQQFGRRNYDPDDSGSFEPNLVAVIMPFSTDDASDVLAAIKESCRQLGLCAVRVDENPGCGLVIREVIDLIERAEFIVCDLTHERPNVYYELGYAHGVGNQAMEVLLIAREGTTLHFDIAPFRVEYYKSIDDLQSILLAKLKRMIEITRDQ